MQLQTVKTQVRETGRKGLATQTRVNGGVPAIIYGGKEKQPVSAAVDRKSLEKLLHAGGGLHAVVQLQFEDVPEHSSPALIKDVQRHPVKGNLLHVDFMRIRLDERIQTQVAVVLIGRAKGVIDGGVIDHQIRELDVECLALEVPEHFEVDVTSLGLGESIHVADIKTPEGVSILTDGDLAVASIHAPRAAKSDEEGAAETAVSAESEEKTAD